MQRSADIKANGLTIRQEVPFLGGISRQVGDEQ